ncbi:MAG: NifU family protein [Phycisphaeraceae bacterium]|nr:NifU family protein [Phycisphaeraceae bacterium]
MTTTPHEPKSELESQVTAVLEKIRPMIQSDGGDLEFIGIRSDGTVLIKLLGACIGCPSSTMTLQMGIERNLVEKVPGVTGVEQVH